MLAGCCVVRSNTGGAYNQIDHGKTGYIFENGNIGQFGQYLHELVADPEKRAGFAAAGRQKALASFTGEVMAKKTLGVSRFARRPLNICQTPATTARFQIFCRKRTTRLRGFIPTRGRLKTIMPFFRRPVSEHTIWH
ncbi:glycosyltransferase [Neisseria musculi]